MAEDESHALTRDVIESGFVQRMIANSGFAERALSVEQLERSLAKTLSARPGGSCPGEPVWLFAYGSLIWNPAFRYDATQSGRIHGWHRRFCLSTPIGRGTPDCPGLVLALDHGGSCRGLAFRIAAADVKRELAVVWRREMVMNSYVPRWVQVREGEGRVWAITFTINPAAPNYEPHLTLTETAGRIARAKGELGSSADYLHHTVQGLEACGIIDVWLRRLHGLVEDQRVMEPN